MTFAAFDPYDWSRLRVAVAEALDRLEPEDRAERIAYCEDRDEHGTSVVVEPDGVLVFTWGGAELVRMPRDAFARYGATPAEMS